jgi:hypothetical protein
MMKGLLIGFIVGGVGSLLIGIIIGALIFAGYGYWQTGGTNIPYNQAHNDIAGLITVFAGGLRCDLKHVASSTAEFLPGSIVDISKFAKGGQFPQSVWLFSEGGKPRLSLVITGPPDKSNAYILEFGRLSFVEIHVVCQRFSIDITWVQSGEQGYALKQINYS